MGAVRVVYNDHAVKVRGCDALLCDIDQFAATVEALIPTAAECAAPTAASTRAAHSRADAATRLVHPLGRRRTAFGKEGASEPRLFEQGGILRLAKSDGC